jgi:hypothetical protein
MFSNPYVSHITFRCVSIGINPWQQPYVVLSESILYTSFPQRAGQRNSFMSVCDGEEERF